MISDIHIPYQDNKALQAMFAYGKRYKPDNVIINGDLLDFYTLSQFDKSPDRKENFADEIKQGRAFLALLRKTFKKAKIHYLEGNHENRLQRYMWGKAPEFYGLESLEINNLLEFKQHDIKYVKCDGDYWGKDTGHLKMGDIIVMHGDSRLNGASLSSHSGYSASATMRNMLSSVIIGHNHRLAKVYMTTSSGTLVGLEGGCLCQKSGLSNWQQGFITFETESKKNSNYRIHYIDNGRII